MSIGLRFDLSTVADAARRMQALQDLVPSIELADAVGAEIEDQIRARISDEKASPDGEPWEPWSARYAKTRHGGNSLLESQGYLLGSITYNAFPDHVVAGSTEDYFAAQNFGSKKQNIPARPVLGFSEENNADLQDVVEVFLRDQLRVLS